MESDIVILAKAYLALRIGASIDNDTLSQADKYAHSVWRNFIDLEKVLDEN